jgi:hypothetical protein
VPGDAPQFDARVAGEVEKSIIERPNADRRRLERGHGVSHHFPWGAKAMHRARGANKRDGNEGTDEHPVNGRRQSNSHLDMRKRERCEGGSQSERGDGHREYATITAGISKNRLDAR